MWATKNSESAVKIADSRMRSVEKKCLTLTRRLGDFYVGQECGFFERIVEMSWVMMDVNLTFLMTRNYSFFFYIYVPDFYKSEFSLEFDLFGCLINVDAQKSTLRVLVRVARVIETSSV